MSRRANSSCIPYIEQNDMLPALHTLSISAGAPGDKRKEGDISPEDVEEQELGEEEMENIISDFGEMYNMMACIASSENDIHTFNEDVSTKFESSNKELAPELPEGVGDNMRTLDERRKLFQNGVKVVLSGGSTGKIFPGFAEETQTYEACKLAEALRAPMFACMLHNTENDTGDGVDGYCGNSANEQFRRVVRKGRDNFISMMKMRAAAKGTDTVQPNAFFDGSDKMFLMGDASRVVYPPRQRTLDAFEKVIYPNPGDDNPDSDQLYISADHRRALASHFKILAKIMRQAALEGEFKTRYGENSEHNKIYKFLNDTLSVNGIMDAYTTLSNKKQLWQQKKSSPLTDMICRAYWDQLKRLFEPHPNVEGNTNVNEYKVVDKEGEPFQHKNDPISQEEFDEWEKEKRRAEELGGNPENNFDALKVYYKAYFKMFVTIALRKNITKDWWYGTSLMNLHAFACLTDSVQWKIDASAKELNDENAKILKDLEDTLSEIERVYETRSLASGSSADGPTAPQMLGEDVTTDMVAAKAPSDKTLLVAGATATVSANIPFEPRRTGRNNTPPPSSDIVEPAETNPDSILLQLEKMASQNISDMQEERKKLEDLVLALVEAQKKASANESGTSSEISDLKSRIEELSKAMETLAKNHDSNLQRSAAIEGDEDGTDVGAQKRNDDRSQLFTEKRIKDLIKTIIMSTREDMQLGTSSDETNGDPSTRPKLGPVYDPSKQAELATEKRRDGWNQQLQEQKQKAAEEAAEMRKIENEAAEKVAALGELLTRAAAFHDKCAEFFARRVAWLVKSTWECAKVFTKKTQDFASWCFRRFGIVGKGLYKYSGWLLWKIVGNVLKTFLAVGVSSQLNNDAVAVLARQSWKDNGVFSAFRFDRTAVHALEILLESLGIRKKPTYVPRVNAMSVSFTYFVLDATGVSKLFSINTVKWMVRAMFAKLNVQSTTLAVASGTETTWQKMKGAATIDYRLLLEGMADFVLAPVVEGLVGGIGIFMGSDYVMDALRSNWFVSRLIGVLSYLARSLRLTPLRVLEAIGGTFKNALIATINYIMSLAEMPLSVATRFVLLVVDLAQMGFTFAVHPVTLVFLAMSVAFYFRGYAPYVVEQVSKRAKSGAKKSIICFNTPNKTEKMKCLIESILEKLNQRPPEGGRVLGSDNSGTDQEGDAEKTDDDDMNGGSTGAPLALVSSIDVQLISHCVGVAMAMAAV